MIFKTLGNFNFCYLAIARPARIFQLRSIFLATQTLRQTVCGRPLSRLHNRLNSRCRSHIRIEYGDWVLCQRRNHHWQDNTAHCHLDPAEALLRDRNYNLRLSSINVVKLERWVPWNSCAPMHMYRSTIASMSDVFRRTAVSRNIMLSLTMRWRQYCWNNTW